MCRPPLRSEIYRLRSYRRSEISGSESVYAKEPTLTRAGLPGQIRERNRHLTPRVPDHPYIGVEGENGFMKRPERSPQPSRQNSEAGPPRLSDSCCTPIQWLRRRFPGQSPRAYPLMMILISASFTPSDSASRRFASAIVSGASSVPVRACGAHSCSASMLFSPVSAVNGTRAIGG